MKISAEGLRLIKSFEGYHTRLPDGRCQAYQCPAGVWTIGYGCTKGVRPGMVWTEAQALEGLDRELDEAEAAVNRLVSVTMNQNEFDPLVSFTYNLGEGALARSTILRKFNAGDRVGAARAFAFYNKARNPKTKKLEVLQGLVARRAREAALFLKPTAAPEAPWMPQQVTAAPPAWSPAEVREAKDEIIADSRHVQTGEAAENTGKALTVGTVFTIIMERLNALGQIPGIYLLVALALAGVAIWAFGVRINRLTVRSWLAGLYTPSGQSDRG